jgi:3-oxoacyl-[acyl-carrier-protein] synthase II
MESLEHAQARGANIICEYLGGATNCDAYHMTVSAVPACRLHFGTLRKHHSLGHHGLRCRIGSWTVESLQGGEVAGLCTVQDPRADGLGVSGCIELALKDAKIERDQVPHACRYVAGQ